MVRILSILCVDWLFIIYTSLPSWLCSLFFSHNDIIITTIWWRWSDRCWLVGSQLLEVVFGTDIFVALSLSLSLSLCLSMCLWNVFICLLFFVFFPYTSLVLCVFVCFCVCLSSSRFTLHTSHTSHISHIIQAPGLIYGFERIYREYKSRQPVTLLTVSYWFGGLLSLSFALSHLPGNFPSFTYNRIMHI